MRKIAYLFLALMILLSAVSCSRQAGIPNASNETVQEEPVPPIVVTGSGIVLPQPRLTGTMPVEQAISERRSVREYSSAGLTLGEVSQLLWAGYGKTSDDGKKTVPSAAQTYPLKLYLYSRDVESLAIGLYQYMPDTHTLVLVTGADLASRLRDASGQESVTTAPAVIIISGDMDKARSAFPEDGEKYVYLEAGHAAQNIYLECQSLGLGTVTVGSFSQPKVTAIIKATGSETPLYLMPVGRKR